MPGCPGTVCIGLDPLRTHSPFKSTSALIVVLLTGCATAPPPAPYQPGLDILWVADSAEYRAVASQIYQVAASRLADAANDPTWTALTDIDQSPSKPPAVILDIDETVLDNSPYQLSLQGEPYSPATWDRWIAARDAEAVPGVARFVSEARAAGISVFFVTNRECMEREGSDEACPQETDTLANLNDVGIPTEPEFLLLRYERPDWSSEKHIRRHVIGSNYRVLMLFGDDLGDFLPCIRARVVEGCREESSRTDRHRRLELHRNYWGSKWFMLPNPMHGSWTTFY